MYVCMYVRFTSVTTVNGFCSYSVFKSLSILCWFPRNMNIPVPKNRCPVRIWELKCAVQSTSYQARLHAILSFYFSSAVCMLLSHERIQDVCVTEGGADSASVRTHPVYTPCLQSQYNCVCVCSTDFPL